MNEVLLTVSGTIDPQIAAKTARGERPEADYMAMARQFEADLLDYAAAREQSGWFGRLLAKIGGDNLTLAWACFLHKNQYKVIFTDGEQVGIPLAFLLKFTRPKGRPRHLMIAHLLSIGKKMILMDWFALHSHVDTYFVYSTWQKKFIETRWRVPADRVVYTPFMVDAKFFAPDQISAAAIQAVQREEPGKPVICAVGLEFRDYPTLLAAVRDLDIRVIVAAASLWSKRSDTTRDQEIPPNVIVSRYTQYKLREVYAASRFVVMPLYPVNFQAGVTAILEAMAMGKAVICSRTPGQTDVVVEGKTGLYVPPQDPAALRAAILSLLDDPSLAEKMGRNGRALVLREMSLECYVTRLNEYVRPARNGVEEIKAGAGHWKSEQT